MNPETVLLVDVGNSRVKWGLGQSGRVTAGAPFSSAQAEPDTVLELSWGALSVPSAAVVANVAGAAWEKALCRWMAARWGIEPRFVAAERGSHGVLNGYEDPGALGTDRWVALIAAHHLCKEAVCVADCGTALTLDAVDGEGRHLGGLIAPGLGLMRMSLRQGTQGIGPASGGRPLVFASNTADAVHGGVLQMAAGAVERFQRLVERRLSRTPRLMLTGGDAEMVASELRVPFRLAPELILSGLLLIAEGDS